MSRLLIIGAGGFVGAILRYWVSGWVQRWLNNADFPYGTLVVNLSGCLIIGVFSYLTEGGWVSPELRSFAMIGILGAFTTFSTFSNETLALLRDGENLPAFANVTTHIVLGLGAAWAGRVLAALIWR